MKKLLLILLFIPIGLFSQTSDVELAKLMLDKTIGQIMPELDSLDIYYKVHYPEDFKSGVKVITISTNRKYAKAFFLETTKNSRIVKLVRINYSHAILGHVKDLEKMEGYEKHVGIYSTDVFIKE